MKKVSLYLLGVAALGAWAVQAQAQVSFSASQSAFNAAGEPVRARVDFKIQRDSILVYVRNTTPNICAVDQAITSLSFSVPGRKTRGGLDYARGITREFAAAPATGVVTSAEAQDLRWTLQLSGSTFTLKAPGKRYGIMPESLTKGEGLLGDRAAASPFVVGTAVFLINMPELELTDMLDGVQFKFGNEDEDGPKISAATGAPDPSHMAGITGTSGAAGDASGIGDPGTDNSLLGNMGAWNYPAPVGDNPVVPHDVGSGSDVSGGGGGSGGGMIHPSSPGPGPTVPTDPTAPLTPLIPLTPPTPAPDPQLIPFVGRPLPVPEPATCALLVLGSAALAMRRRK